METPESLINEEAMNRKYVCHNTIACLWLVLGLLFLTNVVFNGSSLSGLSTLICMVAANVAAGRASGLKESYFLYSKLNEISDIDKQHNQSLHAAVAGRRRL